MSKEQATPKRQTRTVEEFRQIFGLGKSAAYEAIKKGNVRTITFGTRILIPQVEIDRLLGTQG